MADNPVYYDLALHLDQSEKGSLGQDLFGGEWGPVSRQILILEGVGTPSDLKSLFEAPGVQVLVRGEKRERDVDVYRRAKNIRDFILGIPDRTEINGTCYTGFEEASNLAALGKDEEERFVYSMNFNTFRNP